MKNQWSESGNVYQLREVSQFKKVLRPGVYKIEFNPKTGFYLSQTQDDFSFPYKVYGIEKDFINRVVKTYHNTTGNLGILLNGVKGTGKTVTAKQIANELKLPVLIINESFHEMGSALPSFINEIQQDVTVFIDEYEKIFSERDFSVLTVMDGVLDNGFRRTFLLTTNNTYVNDNMIQRPGRIRYLKKFNDLTLNVIMEIVDDKLVHKHLREATIEFISTLELITVDIVKAVVDEVNIHEEDPQIFKDVFNVEQIADKFNVYRIHPGKAEPVLEHTEARISPRKISKEVLGRHFEIEGYEYGRIIEVTGTDTFTTKELIEEDDGTEYEEIKHYKIETTKPKHYAFYGAF